MVQDIFRWASSLPRWVTLLALCGVFGVCAWLFPLSQWIAAGKSGLLIMLSFVLGTIMVRLMRSFPSDSPAGFRSVSEIRNFELDLLRSMGWLVRAAAGVAVTMVVLIFWIVVGSSQSMVSCRGKIGLDWWFCKLIDQPYAIFVVEGRIWSGFFGAAIFLILRDVIRLISMDFDMLRGQFNRIALAFGRFRKEKDASKPAASPED